MENAASVLVLVVHPHEETIGFTSVGVGALAPYRRSTRTVLSRLICT
jgi:hypothetical protein